VLEITLLPAREGDAIWIRWGDPAAPHRILIDMGTGETGERIRNDIEALPQDQRRIDLLVVSHVDRDHIGGVLTCLAEAEPIPGLQIGDVWFNGYEHLSGKSVTPIPEPANPEGGRLEPMGPVQGERLGPWLRQQPWNVAFDGGPVCRNPNTAPPKRTMHDDLTLTILGPTPERLKKFKRTWKKAVEEALEKGTLSSVSPGLEPMGPKVPPVLEYPNDLEMLAKTRNAPDNSLANGSSIALLLEYRNRRVLLSGDAFADDLVEGIGALGGGRLSLDAFKLPHHGSRKNVLRPLVESVDCGRWVFSTDGNGFRHPDPVALARVISYSTAPMPHLCFNVPSRFNGWWDNDNWRGMYNYTTEYGTKQDGLTLSLIPEDE